MIRWKNWQLFAYKVDGNKFLFDYCFKFFFLLKESHDGRRVSVVVGVMGKYFINVQDLIET